MSAAQRYVVWGRSLKRGGTIHQRRWKIAAVLRTEDGAHRVASRFAADPRAWAYTCVRPEGDVPRVRDNEDYCRWRDPALLVGVRAVKDPVAETAE